MKNTTDRFNFNTFSRNCTIFEIFSAEALSSGKNDSNVLAEAEKVVEKYMSGIKNLPRQKKKTSKKKIAHLLCAGIILLGFGIFAVSKFLL